MKDMVRILKVLSDQTRLRIVNMLLEKEVCVCEMVNILGISQPAVSKHIKKLKTAGLVEERQNGYWSYYSIDFKSNKAKKVVNFIMREIKDEKKLKKDIELLKRVLCKTKKECL